MKEIKKNPDSKAVVHVYDDSEVYDWIVDIDLITNIASTGWIITLSEKFYQENFQLFQTK